MDQNDNVLIYNLGAYGKFDVAQNKKYYYLKDHLGNVRVTFTPQTISGNLVATVNQRDSYYPFGLRFASTVTGSENKFTYNGKEYEDDFNLNWYHYGARYYDPQLGRWHAVDPADEFNSPYLGLGNNPIRFNDPNGKNIGDAIYFLFNFDDFFGALKAKASAELMTQAYSKINDDDRFEGNHVDAFRHAYLSIELVRELGLSKAITILAYHEYGGQTSGQRAGYLTQDIFNNKQGLLAAINPDYKNMETKMIVLDLLAKGKLMKNAPKVDDPDVEISDLYDLLPVTDTDFDTFAPPDNTRQNLLDSIGKND